MNPFLIFLLGSLSGCGLTYFVSGLLHSRKFQEAHDEFLSLREAIRRNAYSAGYEDAKTGKLKRA